MSIRSLFVLSALVNIGLAAEVVLPPTTPGDNPVALIFAQGALLTPESYIPLLEQVQKNSKSTLWVGVPQCPLNAADPPALKSAITSVLKNLTQHGMPANTTLIYGGHSLGSVSIQEAAVGQPVAGLVLTGGFLARKHYYPKFNYKIPTLVVAGELDGLARVTRSLAESYYHQVLNAEGDEMTNPVTLVKGMNHMQVSSGAPSAWVRINDLEPEISFDEAHAQTGAIIGDFIDLRMGINNAGSVVQKSMQDAKEFAEPIIAGYELEGSMHFNAPQQYGGPLESECAHGECPTRSDWAPKAQVVIAGQLSQSLNCSNQFVKLSSTPIGGGAFHLPNITATDKEVTVTTYAQNDQQLLDKFDLGIVGTSALEIGTKLASRQCIQIEATHKNVSFDVDKPDFCKEVNEMAYQWGLDNAGEETLKRYQAFGVPLVFGADVPKQGGPLWLYARLEFSKTIVNGSQAVRVSAPMQKTEKDYWKDHFPFPRPSIIPDPGCYHYCKLLSPAYVTEWIYVDSLRPSRSNFSSCETCIGDETNQFCWIDGKCHTSGDKANPCTSKQCVGASCSCQSCSDPTCAMPSALFADDNDDTVVPQRPPHQNRFSAALAPTQT